MAHNTSSHEKEIRNEISDWNTRTSPEAGEVEATEEYFKKLLQITTGTKQSQIIRTQELVQDFRKLQARVKELEGMWREQEIKIEYLSENGTLGGEVIALSNLSSGFDYCARPKDENKGLKRAKSWVDDILKEKREKLQALTEAHTQKLETLSATKKFTPKASTANEWQPIETYSSSDGRVNVYRDGQVGTAHWGKYQQCFSSDLPGEIEGWMYDGHDFWVTVPQIPTHWMPLPPAPEGE